MQHAHGPCAVRFVRAHMPLARRATCWPVRCVRNGLLIVSSHCADAGIEVRRAAAGPFVTSLNMAGISLSVMRLEGDAQGLLDAPTAAPGWAHCMSAPAAEVARLPVPQVRGEKGAAEQQAQGLREADAEFVRTAVEACAAAAAAAEPEITRQDALVRCNLVATMPLHSQVAELALSCPATFLPSNSLQDVAEVQRLCPVTSFEHPSHRAYMCCRHLELVRHAAGRRWRLRGDCAARVQCNHLCDTSQRCRV